MPGENVFAHRQASFHIPRTGASATTGGVNLSRTGEGRQRGNTAGRGSRRPCPAGMCVVAMIESRPEVENPAPDEGTVSTEAPSSPALPGLDELRARTEEPGERVAAHFRLLEGR